MSTIKFVDSGEVETPIEVDPYNGYLEFDLLNDNGQSKKVRLWLSPSTLFLGVDSHGSACFEGDQQSHQVALDVLWEDTDTEPGDVGVHIWTDINQEDPTHRISLNGARLSERKSED